MSTTIELDPPAGRTRGWRPAKVGIGSRLIRRIWNLPIWLHATVLAVVLLSVLPIVGTHSVVFSDEGAA